MSTPFEREKSRYDIVQSLVTNALLTSYSGHKHAKGFVEPIGETIVYRTFSNCNELCTKYHFLSFFFLEKLLASNKSCNVIR